MIGHKRIHAFISGRVQGVFYRANTEKRAVSLGLKGWVRNLPNGQVEVLAEGPEENLKQLMEWCRKGPPFSRVVEVHETWGVATGEFSNFSVA